MASSEQNGELTGMRNLDGFITLGAPIDLIERTIDRGRRSIRAAMAIEAGVQLFGTELLTGEGSLRMPWVNYWCATDPLSAPVNPCYGTGAKDIHLRRLPWPFAHILYLGLNCCGTDLTACLRS